MLCLTEQMSQINSSNIKLSIELEEKQIILQSINVFGNLVSSNVYYSFSFISMHLFQSNITSNSRLTYQFIANETISNKFPIKIVENRIKPNLTARLIKCLYLSHDIMNDFEYILSLIINSNYDSIYICVFNNDHALKQKIAENSLKLKKDIKIFELENLPSLLIGSSDFRTFNDCINNPQISFDGATFDPAWTFLLNLKYSSLIEKYKYVHALDFDHILFTRNKSMFNFIEDIYAKNNFNTDVSLYFNQYWAISNDLSKQIFKNLNFTNSTSNTFPILVKSEKFDLLINDEIDLGYAKKIANHINALNVSDKFRQIILRIKHYNYQGQSVYNTRSSNVINIIRTVSFFPGGLHVTINSSHMIHYREIFFLSTIAKNNQINISSFITWFDLHYNFTAVSKEFKLTELTCLTEKC